jgi:hypothetical protein
MFTSSIVLLMIINTVAASGAVFVALQTSALDARDRVSTSTASTPHAAEKSQTRDGYGFACLAGNPGDATKTQSADSNCPIS